MDKAINGREARGLAIAASGSVVKVDEAGTYRVRSQRDQGTRYFVNIFRGSCTCPDFEGGWHCKHLIAVEIVSQQATADGKGIVTTRRTYSQEWTSYNRAQVEEKDAFVRLLADLCKTVPQPPQAIGRPRLPLSDMAFACTFKVYSRFSSRRFSSDLREAEERGLIRHAPHFNSVSGYLSDPSITPILSELIQTASLPLKAVESNFGVDASGFSACRFDRWLDLKYGKAEQVKARSWVKAHLMAGVSTNIVTAAEVTEWNRTDGRYLPSLVEATAANFNVAEVSADKGYLSRDNLSLIEEVGAVPFVPIKQNTRPIVWEDSAWAASTTASCTSARTSWLTTTGALTWRRPSR